ncbi:ribose transport system ATP-binding protein [Klenkia soli]|uniref:Ribose transport system ATP-binding protein n=1 Tax=Klenkia soli TaxID=1052260 RepID=A0A1H0G4F9_9ACTN|nr:sugar ABC transporter ATP-binding protein [Klenkia soli]SDO01730.1 ribose transport system ATP-binding protein [Klenkia soli]
MTAPLLELRNVTKRFGATTALDDVSITVHQHEVVGLIGENGAGKSTLLKMLAGLHRPDGGQVLLSGDPVDLGSPARAARLGIGVVHQEQSLLPNLRVAENLLLGHEGDALRAGFFRRKRLEAAAAEALATVESKVSPASLTEDLTFAERQMVEVARAVASRRPGRPPLVVLDEPTSVLEAEDVAVLKRQVMALREVGSVIFVSHRLDEVLDFSDRVYVLRDGKVVGERTSQDATEADLFRMMIGRDSSAGFYDEGRQRPADPDAVPVLSVKDLSRRGQYSGVSFDIRPGEVLGLVGVIGSGREQVSRAIFGAEPHDEGSIVLDGQPLRLRTPAAAVRSGIAYVPAERRVEGMVGGATVAENIALVHPGRGPVVLPARRRVVAQEWAERLDIRPRDTAADMARLSGGNQQKAALARWVLADDLRLLILDHPTRGLDIGAKEDLYKLFRDLCERGIGILLLADTLDEAIGMSHSVIVMKDGQVTARFENTAVDGKPQPIQLLEKMM